jgi:phosphatidate cytidylyltransferase
MTAVMNPLASPYFPLVAPLLATLLAGSLLVVLGTHGGRVEGLGSSVLLRRWRTWLVIAVILVGATLGGPLPMLALVVGLTAQCLREFARLVSLPQTYRLALLGAGLPVPVVAALSPDLLSIALPILFVTATALPLLARDSDGIRHLAFLILGWCYAAWLPAHLILLYQDPNGGPGIVLMVALATALSDVGAFTVGRRFGRRPIAPALSPSKTWEGVGGNVVGTAVGVGVMAHLLPDVFGTTMILAFALVIAVGAVWGDLFESAIKRQSGAKDAGAWLPGFGGLLDRADSLLFTGPLVYYLIRLTS